MSKSKDQGFSLPGMSLPGVGDSLEFVKRLWGGLGVPNAIAPTMDVDELDKRIADLRAVEQWLQMNITMLRGTIQGMEVQRATVATLKGFGRALSGKSDEEQLEALRAMAFSNTGSTPVPSKPLRPKPTVKKAKKTATTQTTVDPSAAMASMVAPNAWFTALSEQFSKIAQATTNAGIDVAGKAVGKTVEKTVGAAAGKTAEMITKTAAQAVNQAANQAVNKAMTTAAKTATGATKAAKSTTRLATNVAGTVAKKTVRTAVSATKRARKT